MGVLPRLPHVVSRVRLAVGAAGLIASCAAPAPSPLATQATITPAPTGWVLNVADVDGPPIVLMIDGTVVADVSCSRYTQLREGVGGVQRLPWSLDVRRQGGGLLPHFDVSGGEDFTLLLRGDTVMLGRSRETM